MHPYRVSDRITAGNGHDIWVIIRIIGVGGMGVVVEVRDLRLGGASIALKILLPWLAGDEDALTRFHNEARTQKLLATPPKGAPSGRRKPCANIVAVHRLGQLDDGNHFFVMDYVDGKALPVRRQSPEEALPLAVSVLDGLEYAHWRGVTHRDVKPQNILLAEDDEREGEMMAKLIDFGVALRKGERSSGFAGTLRYCAPEQLMGGDVGPKADVYAVFAILFQMLTGRLPWTEIKSSKDLVHDIVATLATRKKILRLRDLGTFAAALDELVSRGLSYDPEDRPTAEEAIALLEEIRVAYYAGELDSQYARTRDMPASRSRENHEIAGDDVNLTHPVGPPSMSLLHFDEGARERSEAARDPAARTEASSITAPMDPVPTKPPGSSRVATSLEPVIASEPLAYVQGPASMPHPVAARLEIAGAVNGHGALNGNGAQVLSAPIAAPVPAPPAPAEALPRALTAPLAERQRLEEALARGRAALEAEQLAAAAAAEAARSAERARREAEETAARKRAEEAAAAKKQAEEAAARREAEEAAAMEQAALAAKVEEDLARRIAEADREAERVAEEAKIPPHVLALMQAADRDALRARVDDDLKSLRSWPVLLDEEPPPRGPRPAAGAPPELTPSPRASASAMPAKVASPAAASILELSRTPRAGAGSAASASFPRIAVTVPYAAPGSASPSSPQRQQRSLRAALSRMRQMVLALAWHRAAFPVVVLVMIVAAASVLYEVLLRAGK